MTGNGSATSAGSAGPPHEDNPAPSALPSVSIVVIGRNEGVRLLRCLESVRTVDYPPELMELIYVDSDSTDGSAERAERLATCVITVKPARPVAAVARNAGWREAAHELVHFLDGDTILAPDWLRRAVSAMADPEVACVFGRREEIAPNASVYNFWAHHDWYVAPGPANSCAGDAMFRRSVLERTEGFDESLIAGEEPDLCFRIREHEGKTVLSLDAPMTRHDINMTRFTEYWRRCTRTGHAYAEVGGRYPKMRSWRRARWRNLGHTLAGLGALASSAVMLSPWPATVWAALIAVLIARNALNLRKQVGTLGGALLYSCHHYLSKMPMAWGQCLYWRRSLLGRDPQPLIEYRAEAR